MSQRLGHYVLLELLGQGGMAEVYRGVTAGAGGFERPVCIKRVLPYLSGDLELREMFVKEARIAGKLCHSNLVQVFDCIGDGDELAIVMELVAGEDLGGVLRRLGRELMPTALAVYIVGQVLEGLAYAHGQKVVHRDISPHNILISRHGEVKIADFGIAKVMETHATRTGKLKGKLAYMSPEQARARGVDHRTDLYSTGLVLFELLKGRRFFEETEQLRLILEVTHAERPTIEGVNPGLADFTSRLLEPDPDARFCSAEDALDELSSIADVRPSSARELARFVERLRGQEERVAGLERSRAVGLERTDEGRARDEPAGEVVSGHVPTMEMWALSGPLIQHNAAPAMQPVVADVVTPPHTVVPDVDSPSDPNRPSLADTTEMPTLVRFQESPGRSRRWLVPVAIAVVALALLLLGLGLGASLHVVR